MLGKAERILGAVSDVALGRSSVIDLGLGPRTVEDFASLAGPVLTEWKLCASTWFLADRRSLEQKIAALRSCDVTVIAGGTPGEIAAARDTWEEYVALCAELGITRVEIAEGFLQGSDSPDDLVRRARDNGLEVQYEIGRKDMEEDRALSVGERVETAQKWAELGVGYFVIEAREVGVGYALFPTHGEMNVDFVQALLEHFTLDQLVFETPTRAEYTAVLRALGPGACLGNIYPEELFRVETMRRAIHADTIDLGDTWMQRAESEVGGAKA
jgi:phosphosulfolactate synthase (CoM biosynthesis protein A)